MNNSLHHARQKYIELRKGCHLFYIPNQVRKDTLPLFINLPTNISRDRIFCNKNRKLKGKGIIFLISMSVIGPHIEKN